MSDDKKTSSVKKPSDDFKKHLLWSAGGAAVGAIAVMLVNGVVNRGKRVLNGNKKDEETSPKLPNPMGLPGAMSATGFANPWMPSGGAPNPMQSMGMFPAPYANPMVQPMMSDQPPKWFAEFKEQHEAQVRSMEEKIDRMDQHSTRDLAARLRPVDDEDVG